ncbi:MAG: TonB-dependent receptor plug domain-containing protein [Aestuariibacter sp.]
MPRQLIRIVKITLLSSGITTLYGLAADQDSQDDAEKLEMVYVVGTRNAGRTRADLPVAVDSLDAKLLHATGEIELGRMLQRSVPSFNFSSSSISDGTDALRPATLRGLGPDQTLVLINNKRRHTGALLHVNSSVGRGTSGVDFNAIPSFAIKRIDVLRDGAAAQYGSDAIAGVINIVLKDESDSQFSGKIGQFSEGDGLTHLLANNHSFYTESGVITATVEYRHRDKTNRAGLTGTCQYLLPCEDTDNNGITNIADPRELSFPRQNFEIGDARTEQLSTVLNGRWETWDGEYFAFVTLSNRKNQAAGFYRRPATSMLNPTLSDGEATYPDGFLPYINSNLFDYSLNAGYTSSLVSGVRYELSLTVGQNQMEFDISNSLNASFASLQNAQGVSPQEIRNTIQTTAHAGAIENSLATFNIDFVDEKFNKNIAYGAELRRDRYKIQAGELYSYLDYDGTDSGGIGGIQVFPGFTDSNVVSANRWVASGYFDYEWDISNQLLLNGAIRGDYYQGFGFTLNGKAALRYDLHQEASVRLSASTGFRAPSMQQLYFNNTSTQFNSGQPLQVGTFRNNSELAQTIGIPELKEEESINLSLGFTLTGESSTFTLDLYHIDINDRIVISEQLRAGIGSSSLDRALQADQIDRAQFFVNGADTQTKGLDVVYSYQPDGGQMGLEYILAANISDTKVTDVLSPGGLTGIAPEDLFSNQAVSIIESWQPSHRINGSINYQWQQWTWNLAINRFGSYTIVDGNEQQKYGAEWLMDFRSSYQFTSTFDINFGVNNIFNTTPDENRIGQFNGGTLEDDNNSIIVQSDGVFRYSRRTAPFGFNGTFYYAGFNYRF